MVIFERMTHNQINLGSKLNLPDEIIVRIKCDNIIEVLSMVPNI